MKYYLHLFVIISFIFIDPNRYAKVYLLPDRSKSGKRKTKVKKHTLSPMFEENLKVRLPETEATAFLLDEFR